MSIRISATRSRCSISQPPKNIAVANATSTQVLPALTGGQSVVGRYIQNVGGSTIYLTYGGSSDGIDYHVKLVDGQQEDASDSPEEVTAWCPAGTSSVCIRVMRSTEFVQSPTFINQ